MAAKWREQLPCMPLSSVFCGTCLCAQVVLGVQVTETMRLVWSSAMGIRFKLQRYNVFWGATFESRERPPTVRCNPVGSDNRDVEELNAAVRAARRAEDLRPVKDAGWWYNARRNLARAPPKQEAVVFVWTGRCLQDVCQDRQCSLAITLRMTAAQALAPVPTVSVETKGTHNSESLSVAHFHLRSCLS